MFPFELVYAWSERNEGILRNHIVVVCVRLLNIFLGLFVVFGQF